MLRKYTLSLAGVLGLVLSGTGCGESHPHAGYFDVAWNIDSQTYGRTTCERAGLDLVRLGARNARTQVDFFTDFNCVDYQGISFGLPPGDYGVALYAYSPSSEEAVAAYAFPVSYPVDPDYTTTLPEVSLVVP